MSREAKYRFSECKFEKVSSNVGFLGAERPMIADSRLGMAIIALALCLFVYAHTQFG